MESWQFYQGLMNEYAYFLSWIIDFRFYLRSLGFLREIVAGLGCLLGSCSFSSPSSFSIFSFSILTLFLCLFEHLLLCWFFPTFNSNILDCAKDLSLFLRVRPRYLLCFPSVLQWILLLPFRQILNTIVPSVSPPDRKSFWFAHREWYLLGQFSFTLFALSSWLSLPFISGQEACEPLYDTFLSPSLHLSSLFSHQRHLWEYSELSQIHFYSVFVLAHAI